MVRGDMLRFWCAMQRAERLLFSMRSINCMSRVYFYVAVLTSYRVAVVLPDHRLQLPRSLTLNHHHHHQLASQPAYPHIPLLIPLLLLSIHSLLTQVLLRPAAAHGPWLIMCAAHRTVPPMIPRRAAPAVTAPHHLRRIANPELCIQKSIPLALTKPGITV